jgi:cell division initiation protein
MKITPLEIRQKTFEKALRGYNKEEVNAYLQSLSAVWERMLEEQEQLKAQLADMKEDVKKMKEVETTLFKTLRTAEETGATMVQQANKTAELAVKEGKMKADQLLAEAARKAKALVEEAQENAREVITTMEEEVRRLDEVFRQLKHQKNDFVNDFKNTLGGLLQKVERLDDKSEDFDVSAILQDSRQVGRSIREKASAASAFVEDENTLRAELPAPEPISRVKQAIVLEEEEVSELEEADAELDWEPQFEPQKVDDSEEEQFQEEEPSPSPKPAPQPQGRIVHTLEDEEEAPRKSNPSKGSFFDEI